MSFSRFRLIGLGSSWSRTFCRSWPGIISQSHQGGSDQIANAISQQHLFRIPWKNIYRSFRGTQAISAMEMHSTSKFDKRLLVWTKFYPSIDEVPNVVTKTQIKKARDLSRIKFSLWMGVCAVVAFIMSVISGKRARNRGESLEKTGLEWQAKMAEQGRQERAAAAAGSEK